MSDFYYKVYKRDHGCLIAVCDKDICGKVLKTADVDVNINPRFYKDKEGNEDRVAAVLNAAFAANFFGEKSVKLAIKLGLVDKSNVKIIDGVPHAHMIHMTI